MLRYLFIPFGYGSVPSRFFDNDVPVGDLVRRLVRS
jgi:hypothetical protein